MGFGVAEEACQKGRVKRPGPERRRGARFPWRHQLLPALGAGCLLLRGLVCHHMVTRLGEEEKIGRVALARCVTGSALGTAQGSAGETGSQGCPWSLWNHVPHPAGVEGGDATGPDRWARGWDRLPEFCAPLVGSGGLEGLWRTEEVVGPRGWGRLCSSLGEGPRLALGRLQEVRRGYELFKR